MTTTRAPLLDTSRFEVLSQAGEGAAGVVLEVLDRDSKARLAVKMLRTMDAESMRALKREFRVLQDLHHPNLVVPKELLEANGQLFFTMDFVDGSDFISHVRGNEARLRSALAQLVTALYTLHAHHKVHRDIKPSNVLVRADGSVAVLDFGIASDLARDPANDNGEMVGTVAYMAPEQALGEAITPAADWYAVGTMLYEALTGSLPFSGSMDAVLEAKMGAALRPPSALDAGVPGDLNELCVDLLRNRPEDRPEALEILRRLGQPAPSVELAHSVELFVGRGPELDVIESAFADCAPGHAMTLLVEGESGVGKSRLVRAFTERAAARAGALVLRGRCYERESVPYKALDGIIDDLASFLTSASEQFVAQVLPDQAGLLRKVFPSLGAVPSIGEARITQFDAPNPQEMRQRVFELLRALFVSLGERHRLVLVIDDLQWADADSFALLGELMRRPAAPRLFLLASIRSGLERTADGAALLSRIERLPCEVRRIALQPLPDADARALIGQLLDDTGVGDREALVDAVLKETSGHPLFIDELVRHRAVSGDARSLSRLDDALWQRASQLGSTAGKLLDLIVTAGVPIVQQVVADAIELGFTQVYDAMAELRAAHFIRTSGAYRHDTVEPYHDRVRESVLRRIDPAQVSVCHGRLALALERCEDPDAEKLALHWEGAGEHTKAADYATRAADAAAAGLAFDHAATLYTRAIELGGGDASRALQVKLAEALTNAGRGAAAARVYLSAAGASGDNEAIDLRRRAAEELLNSGHMDEGTSVMESVLRAVGIRAPRTPLGIFASLLFRSILLKIRGLKFRERAAARPFHARELLRIDCLYSAGIGFVVTDHFRGKEFNLRTLLAALGSGERSRAARSLAVHATSDALEGVTAHARALATHAHLQRMVADLRQPFLDGMTTLVAAYAHHFSGQWRKGRDYFVQCEALFRDQCLGATFELGTVRMLLCRACAWLGDFRELTTRAGAILREAEQKGDLYTVINVSNPLSYLALGRDDTAEAERIVASARDKIAKRGFHVQHMFGLMSECQLWLYCGEAARTRAELDRQWPAVKRSMLLRVQALHLQLLDLRARACLALAASDASARPELLREAEGYVREIERHDAPWARGLVHMLRASSHHIANERERAIEQLTAAEKELADAGMALHLAITQRRRSELLAAAHRDEAKALRATSDAWMVAQDIRSPARMSALHSPGFP
jgi:serine/threonine protein kinase